MEIYPVLSDGGVYIVLDPHISLRRGPFMDRTDVLSFQDFAQQLCTDLVGWTKQFANFALLGTDRNVELANLASGFGRSTRQISVFESMIVFQRGHRDVPRHEARPLAARLDGGGAAAKSRA